MSGPEDRYAWHFKPWDMLRSKLDEIIRLLKEISQKLDAQNENTRIHSDKRVGTGKTSRD